MRRLREVRAPPIVQAMALALVAGMVGFVIAGTFLTQGFTWPVYILLALTTATSNFVAVNYSSLKPAEAAATKRTTTRHLNCTV